MLLSFQDVSWNWSDCSSSAPCRWGWFPSPSLASALQSVDFPLWCCQSGWPCTTVSVSTSSGASSYSKILNNFHVLHLTQHFLCHFDTANHRIPRQHFWASGVISSTSWLAIGRYQAQTLRHPMLGWDLIWMTRIFGWCTIQDPLPN